MGKVEDHVKSFLNYVKIHLRTADTYFVLDRYYEHSIRVNKEYGELVLAILQVADILSPVHTFAFPKELPYFNWKQLPID